MSIGNSGAGFKPGSGRLRTRTRYRLVVCLSGRVFAVECQPIISRSLATRLKLLLTEFLHQPDVTYVAAASWAFDVRRAIEAAALSPAAGRVYLRAVRAGS